MPQRLLRPGLTTSRHFNKLDWQSQSFYIRLITIVDDYGRCEAEPELLASLCFPFNRDIKCQRIADICQQLTDNGMAIFYQVDGTKFMQLTKWKERTRSESRYPAPSADICQHGADICQQMIASPPQPQPQPQPSPNAQPNNQRPSLAEVLTECDLRAYPKEQGERCWHHFESSGWIDKNGHRIVKWQSKLATWIVNTKARPAEKSHHNGPARAPDAISASMQAMLDTKKLERIEKRMKDIRDSVEGHDTMNEFDREELQDLKKQGRAIKQTLGITV